METPKIRVIPVHDIGCGEHPEKHRTNQVIDDDQPMTGGSLQTYTEVVDQCRNVDDARVDPSLPELRRIVVRRRSEHRRTYQPNRYPQAKQSKGSIRDCYRIASHNPSTAGEGQGTCQQERNY